MAETQGKTIEDSGSALGNKTKHVLGQVWLGLKRGAQLGVIAGVLIGGGMAMAAAGPVTFLGLLGASLLGGLIGSAAGMNTGGFIGGIKGLITRPKPDGDAMMKNAEACAQLQPAPAPETPQQGQQQAAGAALPALKGTGKNPPHSAVSVTNSDAKPAGVVDKADLSRLRELTSTLNQIESNNAVAAAQPPAPVRGQGMQDWQTRVRAGAQQQAELANQR